MSKRTLITTIADTCCPPLLDGIVADDDAVEIARGFAALSDPVRIKILSLLGAAETGEVCACDFVAPTGKSQPTVSHHLKILTEAGLITGDKRGRWVWYRLVPEKLDNLRAILDGPAITTTSA